MAVTLQGNRICGVSPEQPPAQCPVPDSQCRDQIGVQGDGHHQSLVRPALQRVLIRGAQKNQPTLGTIRATTGQMVPQFAVLHPKKLIKIMVMQSGRALRVQSGAGQVNLRPGGKNIAGK